MKLDQSMVGKECQCKNKQPGAIIECDHTLTFCSKCGERIIPLEPKLPSERIRELEMGVDVLELPGRTRTESAIIQYLDEEAKKKFMEGKK